MRPVLSVAEMREADAAATVPVSVLVQRAGRAVAGAAIEMLGGAYGRRIVVVAGRGNNGADGRAAAAVLERRGARVTVLDAGGANAGGPNAGGPHAGGANAGGLGADGLDASGGGVDLVIDAAYGTGFRGDYDAPGTGGAPVLAVDIPSGVHGDTGAARPNAVRALATVTMVALKPGLLVGDGPELAGKVTVADIGVPPGDPASHLVEDADLAWLPSRPRSTHKWTSAAWVVAGSPGMRGAPELCARAAQRAGAGMLHVGSPGLLASEHPPSEAVAVGLPSDGWDETVLAELDRFKSLVVGPGLGRSEAAAAAVRRLVALGSVPTLVDADGLNVLGPADAVASAVSERRAHAGAGEPAPVVLTPHDGEFARLAGAPPGEDRLGAVRDLAARTGAIVLLKGSTTVVADPAGTVLLAGAGDARLATAGTGDVLSGVIGAFLAAGLPGLRAAALGAHVHGRASQHGPAVGLVAGDLPDLVPLVLSGPSDPPGAWLRGSIGRSA